MTVEKVTPILAYAPPFDADDEAAVVAALRNSNTIGNGAICQRVEAMLQQTFDVEFALLTNSCTSALEIAMLTLDIGVGDEVIMPSFTFVSSANCVVLRGATPVFADIVPTTLTIDPDDVARLITPRTRAIIPMHYAGVSCDMDALQRIADRYDIALIEDAAQGVDAFYRGRALGTIGNIGTYSFHATKNIVCGEGGVLLTNDIALAHRAEIAREKGTNRAAMLRGDVDKYTWVAAGGSYVLTDLAAALLETQLHKRAMIKFCRQQVWDVYMDSLAELAANGRLILPTVPAECEPNYHIFYTRTRTIEEQRRLIPYLREHGIPASFHYIPLHSSPFAQTFLQETVSLPQTEHCAHTLVRLPIGTHISVAQADFVAAKVKDFFQ